MPQIRITNLDEMNNRTIRLVKTESSVVDVGEEPVGAVHEDANLLDICLSPYVQRYQVPCELVDAQSEIILNKTRTGLPGLSFINVAFKIYFDGEYANGGLGEVSLLNESAMTTLGLKVEDLNGDGKRVRITSLSDSRKNVELLPTMALLTETDVEVGTVVVNNYSWHFCLNKLIL